jgi:thymidine kinase
MKLTLFQVIAHWWNFSKIFNKEQNAYIIIDEYQFLPNLNKEVDKIEMNSKSWKKVLEHKDLIMDILKFYNLKHIQDLCDIMDEDILTFNHKIDYCFDGEGWPSWSTVTVTITLNLNALMIYKYDREREEQ